MEYVKFCKKCGENTVRDNKSKRCLKCKAALNAAAWQRKKAELAADEGKADAYREACRVRMNAHNERQRVLARHD